MDERTRVWVMMSIATAVLLAAALFIGIVEELSEWALVSMTIIAAIVLLALFFVIRTLRELRTGLPLEDERSRYLSLRAGYRAFYVSMYTVLGLAFVTMLLEGYDVVLSAPEILFVVVAMMGSLHLAFSAYYNTRGKASIE
ncbi:TPA: hypothetical protein HA259_08115 [Thermoplasmata archaeon]|nr:hypothetical protein [Thermoplasmata archaeon]